MEYMFISIQSLLLIMQVSVDRPNWNIFGVIVSLVTLFGTIVGIYIRVRVDIARMKSLQSAMVQDAMELRQEMQNKMDKDFCSHSMQQVAETLKQIQKTAADNNDKIFKIYEVIVEKK